MLIVSLDQYIVVVALPEIGRELGFSAQTLQSVISAYAVASAGFLLLGGRAADLLGRRRVFVAGPRALRRRLARRRARADARDPARRPRGAGARRSARLPRHPVARQHHVRRGARAQPRRRGLGRRRRGRPGHRRAARRRAHPGARLGGGLLRQRAAGRTRDPARVRADPRRPAARARPQVRPARCAHAPRSAITLLVFALVRGPDARLGLAGDPGRRGREPRRAGGVRAHRAAQPRPARAAAAARQPQPRHRGRDRVPVLGDLRLGALLPHALLPGRARLRRPADGRRIPAPDRGRGGRLGARRSARDALSACGPRWSPRSPSARSARWRSASRCPRTAPTPR